MQAKFSASLGRPFFVPEKNNFNIWMEKRPALQRISLDDAVVAPEWLARGKKSDHWSNKFLIKFQVTTSLKFQSEFLGSSLPGSSTHLSQSIGLAQHVANGLP